VIDVDPDDVITEEVPIPKASTAKSAVREGAEVAEERLEKEVMEEGAEWLAEKGMKKVFSVAPVGGLIGEFVFPEDDATWQEKALRGIGGEIGFGPFDLTTLWDINNPSQYEEPWHPACTAGCHYGTW